MRDEAVASPYVRPSLAATRAGIPDPFLLVDLWADTLRHYDGEAAQEIVGVYGRLVRARPELLAAVGLQDRLTDCREEMMELSQLALAEFNPLEWPGDMQALIDAADDAADEQVQADLACQVLDNLESLGMVAWMLQEMRPDRLDVLEKSLDFAHCLIRENPDRFFAAGVYVQGLGQTVDPGLIGRDPELTKVSDHIVVLLDALEEAQALLS